MCPSMQCLLKDQHEQWKCRTDRSSPRRSSVATYRTSILFTRVSLQSMMAMISHLELKLHSAVGAAHGKERKFVAVAREHATALKNTRLCIGDLDIKVCRHILISFEVSDSTRNVKLQTKNTASCNTPWPEYEIAIEDECIYDDEASEDCGSAASLLAKQHMLDDSFQVLLDEFEADDDKKTWASFLERIGNAPEQVLRCCGDVKGRPLWPVSAGRPSKADIP